VHPIAAPRVGLADFVAALLRPSDDPYVQVVRPRLWLVFAVAIAFLASMKSVPIALAQQEDPADPNRADESPSQIKLPPSPDGALTVACGVHPLPSDPDGASRAIFTCWVSGAPDADVSFTLEVVRLGQAGELSRPIGAVCENSALVDGKGTCEGTVVEGTRGAQKNAIAKLAASENGRPAVVRRDLGIHENECRDRRQDNAGNDALHNIGDYVPPEEQGE
jgi:hypothetical protein